MRQWREGQRGGRVMTASHTAKSIRQCGHAFGSPEAQGVVT